jgi:hypothetical protein
VENPCCTGKIKRHVLAKSSLEAIIDDGRPKVCAMEKKQNARPVEECRLAQA